MTRAELWLWFGFLLLSTAGCKMGLIDVPAEEQDGNALVNEAADQAGADLADAGAESTADLEQPDAGEIDAGPDTASGARLLFRSGFEDSVSMAAVFGRSTLLQVLVGSDSPGSTWPINLWGTTYSGIQNFIGDQTPEDVTSYLQNQIAVVVGPDGRSTRALSMQIFKDSPGTCCTQDPLILSGLPAEPGDFYVRYWIKQNTDLLQQIKLEGSGFWRILWEAKATPDYRIQAGIGGDEAGNPFWYATADTGTAGTPFWYVKDSQKIPVKGGEWFTMEIFLHRSTGPDGRFWWAVNGQVLVDQAGLNFGATGATLSQVQLAQLYGHGLPARQWIDDLEIWDGFPCVSPPCGPFPE